MAITIEEIKQLRELTGVGMTDAKRALQAAEGDFDKALEQMRIKGQAKAEKRSGKEALNGTVSSYVHSDRIGVILEVNCETDFVARNEKFTNFTKDIAMHIAASAPRYISEADVPADVLAKEKELILAELKEGNKPEAMLEKISAGKLAKFYDQICLLNQPYIKNPDLTVDQYLKERIAQLGENIIIRKIARIELGASVDA